MPPRCAPEIEPGVELSFGSARRVRQMLLPERLRRELQALLAAEFARVRNVLRLDGERAKNRAAIIATMYAAQHPTSGVVNVDEPLQTGPFVYRTR